MSNYKKYFISQLGLKESLKPAGIQPSDVDPSELESGVRDETEHTDDANVAKKIALQHLKKTPDYYSRIKKAGLEEDDEIQSETPSSIMSPTAISTPVIAMAVRGSSTGGLPSGADRGMSLSNNDGVNVSNLSPSQLGGYEPIPSAKNNSKLINKTPNNSDINSSTLKIDSQTNTNDNSENHPHQFQKSQGEAPQNVTGASVDSDDSLTLKMAMPKGVDVDIQEDDAYDEYEHGSDEDNHRDNPEFQKKDAEQFRKDRSASPVGDEIRKSMGINETFTRHLKLMNETIDSRNLAECDCGPQCDCDGCMEKHKEEPKKVEEKYSAPFEKMRGLANLGERRVSKDGLWESSHKPGKAFKTNWKMDKKKAGMVKVDEKRLLSIKEDLSKKSTLTEKEIVALKKIEEVLKNRTAK